MKLYYAKTPNPRKTCAVAKYLNAPLEYVFVDLMKGENRTPEFRAINPNCKVPALVVGKTKLWEAMAIMCYLAEQAGSDLWPDDERRVDVIRWLSWDALHFSRHGGALFFEHVIKPYIGAAPEPARAAESTDFFRQFAAILNNHLAGRRYVVGDSVTLADFSLAAMLPYAQPSQIPVEEFPEIMRWHAGLNEIEAWRDPFPVPAKVSA